MANALRASSASTAFSPTFSLSMPSGFLDISTIASRYSLVTTNWAMVPEKLSPVTGMPRMPSWYTVLV